MTAIKALRTSHRSKAPQMQTEPDELLMDVLSYMNDDQIEPPIEVQKSAAMRSRNPKGQLKPSTGGKDARESYDSVVTGNTRNSTNETVENLQNQFMLFGGIDQSSELI